ncbi:hypothetical protein PSTG_16931 [Puccinia striiformis f. sp. tritici PST-78]|uniref:Prenyltransferase alpha-alpha toroid domain-containing protein n=1 Tax=Puccinia striiformis f. sp. tritici PST-78 TaxID=1165861 RepID=A0A0L0URA3_9BASI|nr:hypothetical protein PSTG_16931 [Puccinia striiformis f. sp. tritici PST-78]
MLAMIRVDPGKVIDVNSTEHFLKSCRHYEGGYGQTPYCEAQGGTTYCTLALLVLLERDNEDAARGFQLTACGPGIPSLPHESNKLSGTNDQPTPIDGVPPTSRRTVAGFQGRIGKPLDACYLFWYTAGLTV